MCQLHLENGLTWVGMYSLFNRTPVYLNGPYYEFLSTGRVLSTRRVVRFGSRIDHATLAPRVYTDGQHA